MNPSDIYHKTPKGQAEIATKTDALNMKERRVLILVNGENSVDTLARLALCDDVEAILERLLDGKFITSPNAACVDTTETEIDVTEQDVTERDVTERDVAESAPAANARELMCNTLLTFGNRVRVGGLIKRIGESDGSDALRALVDPWYEALTETPGGMYQADDLKQEVLSLIDSEEPVAS